MEIPALCGRFRRAAQAAADGPLGHPGGARLLEEILIGSGVKYDVAQSGVCWKVTGIGGFSVRSLSEHHPEEELPLDFQAEMAWEKGDESCARCFFLRARMI